MTLQVSLREFSNLPEESVLRFRGRRVKVEVTDDFGEKTFSDTYALMVTWQGMIVHRAYPELPYSIKELVPSNIANGKISVVYDTNTLAIPLNYCLQELMPNIHDPIETDFIKRMVHIWQGKLNNLLVVMSEESVISATAEDVMEFMEDPGIIEIKRKVQNNEVTIDEGEELFKNYVGDAPSLDSNTLAMMARTGGVSINQAYQTTIIRGAVFDLNNAILPNAVKPSYADGIVNLTDSMGDSRGSGKAELISNLIKIPNGWKRMGDIEVGDKVITPSGYPTTVTHVHPQGITKVYRVHFKDGRYTDVSPEHLWKVYHRGWCHIDKEREIGKENADLLRWRVIPTTELIRLLETTKSDKGWCYIPLCSSERNEDKVFKIHPYVMGVLLGDGSFTAEAVEITKPYQQLFDKVESLLPNHLKCSWKADGKTFSITFKDTKDWSKGVWHPRAELKNLDLMGKRSWEKAIPADYLHGSHRQRLELLRGLLDTDGTVGKKKCISFSSSSEKLAIGVQYLVHSLGGIARISPRNSRYTHNGEQKIGRMDYRVSIRYPRPKELFTLQHKQERAETGQYSYVLKLRITHVEERPNEETKCITVDHPDHLYLTWGFVVTHNSLTSNGRGLQDAETFHRKTHLYTSVLLAPDYMYDCGTPNAIQVKITSTEMAMAFLGKFRVLDSGERQLIDYKTVKQIKVGETINVRSIAFCNVRHSGKPCGICFGMMKANIPYNTIMRKSANIGMYAGTTICNPLGQKMLSTKHFIRNAVTKAFTPIDRDRDIITSNGNEIFLTKEMARPGTKMVLRETIVKSFSDLRSLDVLDEVNLDKLPYFEEVVFGYEVEDIMIGGKTVQKHPVITSVSSRQARLSMGMLRYILENGWETEDKKFISIDMSMWNPADPVFVLPFVREDLDAHRSRVENFLTFNKRNNAWRKQVVTTRLFGEVLAEFWTLINQETKGMNIVHIESILACTLTRNPDQLDYSLALGDGEKYFSSYVSCIDFRGIGNVMIFEHQQNTLNQPRTFMIKNRQGSPLETFFKAIT